MSHHQDNYQAWKTHRLEALRLAYVNHIRNAQSLHNSSGRYIVATMPITAARYRRDSTAHLLAAEQAIVDALDHCDLEQIAPPAWTDIESLTDQDEESSWDDLGPATDDLEDAADDSSAESSTQLEPPPENPPEDHPAHRAKDAPLRTLNAQELETLEYLEKAERHATTRQQPPNDKRDVPPGVL